jgi:hypothetical protein
MAAAHMFLAMILTNAKREEARALTLFVEDERPGIDMLLLDGSCRQLSPPPAEIMLGIIESLEGGETLFESSVYSVTVEQVEVRRGSTSMIARISTWTVAHR